jgi:hypothetical protein
MDQIISAHVGSPSTLQVFSLACTRPALLCAIALSVKNSMLSPSILLFRLQGTKLGIWVCTLYFNTTGNLNGGSDWPLVDPDAVRNWVSRWVDQASC